MAWFLSYHGGDGSCNDGASGAVQPSAGLRFDKLARRPIREARFDEALGLAVGLGRIGSGEDLAQTEALASGLEGP